MLFCVVLVCLGMVCFVSLRCFGLFCFVSLCCFLGLFCFFVLFCFGFFCIGLVVCLCVCFSKHLSEHDLFVAFGGSRSGLSRGMLYYYVLL